MSQEALQKNSFWIYGAFVALGIKQALDAAVPAILLIKPAEVPLHVVGARLAVFVATIVAFYIGSGNFFDHHHGAKARNGQKSFGLDFPSGLVHFTVFVAWSYTLAVPGQYAGPLSAYLLILIVILSYDCMWWFASISLSTAEEIGVWARRNFFTAVALLLTFASALTYGLTPENSELLALVPVCVLLTVDYRQLLWTSKSYPRSVSHSTPD